MTPELARRVAAVAAESRAGASALLRRAVPILQAAQREDQAVLESVALALCAAQSSMASLWNAVALALRQDDGVGLSRYAERARRSPAILGRFAVAVLTSGDAPATPLAVATVSASGSVRQCLQELSRRCELHVVCAESRPLYEGRQLAAELTADSIATTVCTDAAVGGFLELVDAVLVGADAIFVIVVHQQVRVTPGGGDGGRDRCARVSRGRP